MTKEQANLIVQRKASRIQRRLKARYSGLMPAMRNPGYTMSGKDSSKEYKDWYAKW